MQVKTINQQICILMTEKEAQWINEDLEEIDLPNNGLISLNIFKDLLITGLYLDE